MMSINNETFLDSHFFDIFRTSGKIGPGVWPGFYILLLRGHPQPSKINHFPDIFIKMPLFCGQEGRL